MPLTEKNILSDGAVLALWEITEPADELLTRLNNYKFDSSPIPSSNPVRTLPWLASRLLICELYENETVELLKDAYNKPSLSVNNKSWKISITHCGNLAGVLIHPNAETGIDLEKHDSRISRVKHKFLTEEELKFAGADTDTLKQTIIWSAKEALYKIYGKKELDFRKHLHISHFNPETDKKITGIILKNEIRIQTEIQIRIIGNFVLTYCIHL